VTAPIAGIPSEKLTSQQGDLYVHARYPTGLTTLCGLEAGPATRGTPPTCPVCVAAARVFHGIDRSAPRWFGIKHD
jgi:hypothetical protein